MHDARSRQGLLQCLQTRARERTSVSKRADTDDVIVKRAGIDGRRVPGAPEPFDWRFRVRATGQYIGTGQAASDGLGNPVKRLCTVAVSPINEQAPHQLPPCSALKRT